MKLNPWAKPTLNEKAQKELEEVQQALFYSTKLILAEKKNSEYYNERITVLNEFLKENHVTSSRAPTKQVS